MGLKLVFIQNVLYVVYNIKQSLSVSMFYVKSKQKVDYIVKYTYNLRLLEITSYTNTVYLRVTLCLLGDSESSYTAPTN